MPQLHTEVNSAAPLPLAPTPGRTGLVLWEDCVRDPKDRRGHLGSSLEACMILGPVDRGER